MSRYTKLTLATVAVAVLAACGGGGESATPGSTSTTTPTVGYQINEVPLVTSVAPPPYPAGSYEAGVFNHANQMRAECGFGLLSSDGALNLTADDHAKYLTLQYGDMGNSPHEESNKSNPWYRGSMPIDRASTAKYSAPLHVSEGLTVFGSIVPAITPPANINASLLNAPYHGLDLLAPLLHLAVGAEWMTKMGLINTHPGANLTTPVEWGAIVNNYGTSVDTRGLPNVQTLPKDDVLTWPCSNTSASVPTRFWGETPYPLGTRDLSVNPAGSPFYFVSRLGSNLTITNIHLYNTANGAEIPLLPVRYMRNEIYPGTTQPFTSSWYMDAAFVFPDVILPNSSTLRMDFTATANGKTFSKSVTYKTGFQTL